MDHDDGVVVMGNLQRGALVLVEKCHSVSTGDPLFLF
jgi:hypothetical protein